MPVLKISDLIADRVRAIQQKHSDTGISRSELDLSGGVDSAVMLGLLVLALGAENVTCVFLGINSNPDALARAQGLATCLGV